LVPCGKRADDLDNDPKTVDPDQNCKFEHLMILFGRIIDYLLVLLVPLTVLVAIYTGVQMILHRQIPAELMKYKDNLIRIGWGVAVMLLAWTIIATLLKTFVDPGSMRFILLDLLG
jgi:predicted small integral membrane protein